jgi:hypothetical protein
VGEGQRERVIANHAALSPALSRQRERELVQRSSSNEDQI